MKPVLIVEGKQQEIYAMYYRDSKVHSITVTEQGGVLKTYHDTSENTQYYKEKPLQIDFNECLKWQGRYDDLHKEIQKELDVKESQMMSLAIENMHNELPFTPNEARKKYFDLLNQQVGLMDAQEVIELFMDDDVDLSGGEEIER